jgi:hypothetical protein
VNQDKLDDQQGALIGMTDDRRRNLPTELRPTRALSWFRTLLVQQVVDRAPDTWLMVWPEPGVDVEGLNRTDVPECRLNRRHRLPSVDTGSQQCSIPVE